MTSASMSVLPAQISSKISIDLASGSEDEKSFSSQLTESLKFDRASAFATAKFQEYGLVAGGWTWKWNSRLKTTSGTTDYKTKCISLAPIYVSKASDTDVQNTILHEIAHALTPGHKHDAVWKSKAKSIGCNGDRCHNVDVRTKPIKFLLRCPTGCTSVPSLTNKRKKDYKCDLCKEILSCVSIGALARPITPACQ